MRTASIFPERRLKENPGIRNAERLAPILLK
jgi:hypothetical protein